MTGHQVTVLRHGTGAWIQLASEGINRTGFSVPGSQLDDLIRDLTAVRSAINSEVMAAPEAQSAPKPVLTAPEQSILRDLSTAIGLLCDACRVEPVHRQLDLARSAYTTQQAAEQQIVDLFGPAK